MRGNDAKGATSGLFVERRESGSAGADDGPARRLALDLRHREGRHAQQPLFRDHVIGCHGAQAVLLTAKFVEDGSNARTVLRVFGEDSDIVSQVMNGRSLRVAFVG